MSSQLLFSQCRRKRKLDHNLICHGIEIMNHKYQVQGLLPRSQCSGIAGCLFPPKQICEREYDYALEAK